MTIPPLRTNWIQTVSGRQVPLVGITPEDIDIADIAHALSRIPRFNGHTKAHYSVAQHSVIVCDLMAAEKQSSEVQLIALLHDAAEAYVGDCVRPLKTLLNDFSVIEQRVMKAIGDRYGVDLVKLPAIVKRADDLILSVEQHYLRRAPYNRNSGDDFVGDTIASFAGALTIIPAITPWAFLTSRNGFIERFRRLTEAPKTKRRRHRRTAAPGQTVAVFGANITVPTLPAGVTVQMKKRDDRNACELIIDG